MTITQDDVDRWAATVARAYAEACSSRLSADDEARLARELNTPLADCLMLRHEPTEWASRGVDAALGRWEAMFRRPRGPRLGVVDYGNERVTLQ